MTRWKSSGAEAVSPPGRRKRETFNFQRSTLNVQLCFPDGRAAVSAGEGLAESVARLGRLPCASAPLARTLDTWVRELADRDLARGLDGRWLWWIPATADGEAGAVLLADDPLPDDLLARLFDAV